jgi:hypothetical protein
MRRVARCFALAQCAPVRHPGGIDTAIDRGDGQLTAVGRGDEPVVVRLAIEHQAARVFAFEFY